MHKVSTGWGHVGGFYEERTPTKDYPQLWIKVGTGVTCEAELSDDPRLRLDAPGEVCDLIEQAASLCHELPDLAIGVHHGRVIAATESLSDLGERQIGELSTQVHGDLSSGDQHS